MADDDVLGRRRDATHAGVFLAPGVHASHHLADIQVLQIDRKGGQLVGGSAHGSSDRHAWLQQQRHGFAFGIQRLDGSKAHVLFDLTLDLPKQALGHVVEQLFALVNAGLQFLAKLLSGLARAFAHCVSIGLGPNPTNVLGRQRIGREVVDPVLCGRSFLGRQAVSRFGKRLRLGRLVSQVVVYVQIAEPQPIVLGGNQAPLVVL